jgi:peroxiredoxin
LSEATQEATPAAPPAAPPLARPSRWARQVIGPFTLRHLAVLGASVLLVLPLLALLNTPIPSPDGPQLPAPGSGFYQLGEPTTGLSIGQRAPELEGQVGDESVALRGLDGEVVRLADRHGSPVWLSFFATWCPPCQEETPVLRAAHERYADRGLRMVAVSVQETTAEDVRAYAQTYELPYTIGFDATSAVFRTYQGFGLPTHVFLDAAGVIRSVYYGPLSMPQVERIVEPLLGQVASEVQSASGR